MSPVRKTNPRTVIFAVATFAIGTVFVLAVFVFAVGRATQPGGVEVKLGSDTFNAGTKQSQADAIRAGGPLLFSDVSGGERDIYLQHDGDSPDAGWYAFDARRVGQPRSCVLRWDAAAHQFTDPCGGPPVPADGAGLVRYEARVDENGSVIVDFNADKRRAATTTTAAPPPTESTTTSTIKITGASR